jgi:hypothetical protein
MIVSKHFVYIHTSRTAGTFLNKLILDHVPGARMVQYHGHLADLPPQFSHLPVIGFVRNPWDWYVSMFFDYRRKGQYVFKIVSAGCLQQFDPVVTRFLKLGDNSPESKRLLNNLTFAAPKVIDANTPSRRRNPGLLSKHFANFPGNQGYYSWLFQLMYESNNQHQIHIGRFENLREETLRLFELTGTPITKGISYYLNAAKALNASNRPDFYFERYSGELEKLVAEKDKYLIDRFGYDYLMADIGSKYPKANFFRELGTVNVDSLIERVEKIPDSQWVSENEGKPNKYDALNDTRHIVFRFFNGGNKIYDYDDHPLWEKWKDLLLPIMETAANNLGYKNYRFPRVMFAKIPAGGKISPHTDDGAGFYIHKIHVPLITNEGTIFHIGSESRRLPVGDIVEVNNRRKHSVDNDGDLDRIHLIFECYNLDDYGKSD